MDDRGKLMAVLRGEGGGRLPWFADLSYLYGSLQARGALDERFRGDEGYVRFHRELGAGICFYAPWLWTERHDGTVTESVAEQDGIRTTTVRTTRGGVRQVERYLPRSYTWGIVEHFVKETGDLRILLDACEHRTVQPSYEEYRRTAELWADTGCAVGLAPICGAPLQRLLTRWAGPVATMELYADHREELEAMMKALEEFDDPIFDIIRASPCTVVEFPENLSAEVTGRRFFETYNAPLYARRNAALHRAGKKTSIHNDGSLRGTFDLLGPVGFDVIEAVTPAPVGDIPLEELRRAAGPGVVLWGGLPGALFSPCYSDEQFESHLQAAVRCFRNDGRCVLGVADQVPPDGLLERVRRVREVVEATEPGTHDAGFVGLPRLSIRDPIAEEHSRGER
jgi:hypothetical protein